LPDWLHAGVIVRKMKSSAALKIFKMNPLCLSEALYSPITRTVIFPLPRVVQKICAGKPHN
jgi:hypothetical protein